MDKLKRPEWDVWFMSIAFIVSQRSLDPSTKHGCVIVSDEKEILSVGYNSPPRGSVDEVVPLTRPEKYAWMIHAEDNAIINAAKTGTPIKDSIFYITGHPCVECFRRILNVQAKKIIYGVVTAVCVNSEEIEVINRMNSDVVTYGQSNKKLIELVKFEKIEEVKLLLGNTTTYIDSKLS